MPSRKLFALSLLGAACAPSADDVLASGEGELKAVSSTFDNEAGQATTVSTGGPIDTSSANPFFKSFGTNGRTCGSCHVPTENWTITPEGVRERFERTQGLDPIFATNDGSNSPNADVSTVDARRNAFSMLREYGVIRVGLPVPAEGELELVGVDDPYGFASESELSLFRRPLPSTNLAFLTATMWDGRESSPLADPLRGPNARADLLTQSNSATKGHAASAEPLPQKEREAIVDFELGLFTAQTGVNGTSLSSIGARGGVANLSSETFYFGINDVIAGDPRSGKAFDPRAMTLFDAWSGEKETSDRAAIHRGQELFNAKRIEIKDVRGVNDALGVPMLEGTCTTCHDSPNVGNHSVRLPLDLGLTDASRRMPGMPLYTLCKRTVDAAGKPVRGTCDPGVPHIQTTDPGRAMVTGKWAHLSTFKGPILRGLSGRAPYFHNGFAKDLPAVVTFYNDRFSINLTEREKSDLVAFLKAL